MRVIDSRADVLQTHVLGAADRQDAALPRHADRPDLPHLERLFGNWRLRVQLQADRLRSRGVQPDLHPLAAAGRFRLPIAKPGACTSSSRSAGRHLDDQLAQRSAEDLVVEHGLVWTTPSPTSTAIVSVTLASPAAFSVPPDLGCQLTVNWLVAPEDRAECVASFASDRSSEVRCGAT